MSKPRWLKRWNWKVLWYPIAGVVLVDLLYQALLAWRLAGKLADANPAFLSLAVLNQLAMYVVLVPAMQVFFAAAKISLSWRRTFGLLATGLAFARIVPLGEYLVWRTGLRKERGGA